MRISHGFGLAHRFGPARAATWIVVVACGTLLAPAGAAPLGDSPGTIRFGVGTFYPLSGINDDSPAALYDLDGTQGLDLVTCHADSVLVLANTGDGTLGAPRAFATGVWVGGVAAADLDGDGIPDLVAMGGTTTNEPRVVVLRGLGGMAFGRAETYSLPALPMCLAVGDMNGDHRTDVLVSSADLDSLWILPGDGAGGLETPIAFATRQRGARITLADFDSNGVPDVGLLAMWSYGKPRSIEILMNRGAWQLDPMPAIAAASDVSCFSVVDADEDGRLDVVMITSLNARFDQVEVALGFGDGTFGRPAPAGAVPRSGFDDRGFLGSADLDRDGHMDLLSINQSGGAWGERGYCTVQPGFGDGRFGPPRSYMLQAHPTAMCAGDLDGDGAPDLVATVERGNGLGERTPGAVVLHNHGDGTLDGSVEVRFDPGRNGYVPGNGAVEAVFLRARKTPDLVVTDAGRTFVVLNETHDEYSPPIDVGPGQLEAFADLDGDGLDDLVLALLDTTRVWRSLGDGHFAAAGEYVGGTWVGLADLDGDGRRDLVLRGADGRGVLRRGGAGGTFAGPESLGLVFPPETRATAFADLDGDGWVDVASLRQTRADWRPGAPTDSLALWFNQGKGGFGSPDEYGLPRVNQTCCFYPTGIAVGDFAGAGRRDLVVQSGVEPAGDSYSSLSVFVNNSDRSFTARVPNLVQYDYGLRAADFNRDGLADLVTVNSNGSATFCFTVYQGTGSGNLLRGPYYRVADFPSAVGIGDLDGDELPDVVTYTSRYGSLVITHNRTLRSPPTGTLLSLVSSHAEPGHVELAWSGTVDGSASIRLQRGGEPGEWTTLATLLPDGTGTYRYTDLAVASGARYAYRLGILRGGTETFTDETWIDVPARFAFALAGARPNPAGRAPVIAFSLSDAGVTTLDVLDVAGRRVWRRRWETLDPGDHRVRLDGAFRPGVYLVHLSHRGRSRVSRMSVVE